MANNVTANAGTGGPVFATDDIGGVHYPITKLAYGGEDELTWVQDHRPLPVELPYGAEDTFSSLRVTSNYNEIEVPFYKDTTGLSLTTTTAGGGSNTFSGGYLQMASSTGTTGEIKNVSNEMVSYISGGEVYAMFSVAWLDGGQASCNQRIGLYDTNNGFFIGYEGTTFGVTVRTGASDTQTAKASFNVDTLTGAASSHFLRAGTPEAIDLTKLNVFRIRYGWLGSAQVKFEVLSPDNRWILFHVIRQPNLSATPHIAATDLPVTAHIVKTAGATNVRMNTACWAAGVTSRRSDEKDQLRISVTSAGLTTATTAYTAGDTLGTLFTIPKAARIYGGVGAVTNVTLIDAADIIGPVDVILFTGSVTLAADNAAFAISDADALKIVGVVPLSGAFDIGNNRVCQSTNLYLPYVCDGTALYAGLMTRSGHTFFGAVGNLQLIVTVERN